MSEFAGSLRQRVTIERRLESRDGRGGANGPYAYDGIAWASVTPLVPADLVAAEALSFVPRWRVTMRKREGITATTRIVWQKRFMMVRGVESDPREPAQMILTCQEVRRNG
jgi:head-tail adaptor